MAQDQVGGCKTTLTLAQCCFLVRHCEVSASVSFIWDMPPNVHDKQIAFAAFLFLLFSTDHILPLQKLCLASQVIDGVCVLLQGSRNSSRSSSPSVRMMPPDKTGSRGYFSPDDPTGTHDNWRQLPQHCHRRANGKILWKAMWERQAVADET